MSRLASLDLGTNTLRLLIAEASKGNILFPILTKRAITRLGEGLHKNGLIKAQAIKRSLEVLDDFSKIINYYKVEKVFAVSTSVAREAKNTKEFIAQILERTGIPVRILTGSEEAELTLKGVFSVIKRIAPKSLIFDIGGGSTEFILTKDTSPIKLASIRLGVVHLAENLITSDPPTPRELSHLRSTIKDHLQSFDFTQDIIRGTNSSPAASQFSLIGTAGTVTTLAAIDQQMKLYDPLKINNYQLTREVLEKIYLQLICSSIAQRKTIPGLEEGRAEVIIPGTAIVLEIMDYFRIDQLTVSDAGLLEGILLKAQHPDGK